MGKKAYFLVKCPKCGRFTYYAPKKSKHEIKRRRRLCPFCKFRYKLEENKTILAGPFNSDEISFLIRKMNKEYVDRKPISGSLMPTIQKIIDAYKKTFNLDASEMPERGIKEKNNLFFKNRPNFGHRSIPPRPTAQGFEIEADRVHIWGYFSGPEVFERLGGDPVLGRLSKNLGFGQIIFYSSGYFDAYIDLSDPLNESLFWAYLRTISRETGCRVVETRVKEGEVTVNVYRESELFDSIQKTLTEDVSMLITKGRQVKTYFKKGRRVDLDKYRIESSSWGPIYDTIVGYLDGKISLQAEPVIFMILSPVEEKKVDQCLVQLQKLEHQINTLEQEHISLINALNQLSVLIMHHDSRMIQEHEAIMHQHREIIGKLERLYFPHNVIEQEIIHILEDRPMTIDEIAAALGMQYHTVYYHIRLMTQRGILNFEYRRTGRRGRPKKVYYLRG